MNAAPFHYILYYTGRINTCTEFSLVQQNVVNVHYDLPAAAFNT
jgi:hypothetical protein